MADQPLIFVDLIEALPLDFDQFVLAHPSRVPDFDERYRQYLAKFQPWRAVVKSGDNHTVLFVSSEHYFNRADLMQTIFNTFGPVANVYLREREHGNVELRLAQNFTAT